MNIDNCPPLDWHINEVMEKLHGFDACLAACGMIPMFLTEADPRLAWEQIDERYAHGGGWNAHLPGKWVLDQDSNLRYPGDPAMQPIASANLHGNETILIYPHAFVCIVQRDGSFSVARID